MSAKDVVWTIVISVFVTCYVMWRMHSVLGEKEADDPPEKGLAAECGEDDSVNAGEGPFSCPQEGVSEPRRRFSGCDCGALTVDGFPAFLRESTQDKGADSPFGDIGRRALCADPSALEGLNRRREPWVGFCEPYEASISQ